MTKRKRDFVGLGAFGALGTEEEGGDDVCIEPKGLYGEPPTEAWAAIEADMARAYSARYADFKVVVGGQAPTAPEAPAP